MTHRRRFMPKVTKHEITLHRAMSNAGLSFRSQEPIKAPNGKTYLLDFLVEGKLNVEVDGATHDHPTRVLKDEERDEALTQMGITVVRFKNWEIKQNLGECVNTIKKLL